MQTDEIIFISCEPHHVYSSTYSIQASYPTTSDGSVDDDESDEFSAFAMTLMAAAKCVRYETVEYFLSRDYTVQRPNSKEFDRGLWPTKCPTWCPRYGKRSIAYRAVGNQKYVRCTTAKWLHIRVSFRSHKRFLCLVN